MSALGARLALYPGLSRPNIVARERIDVDALLRGHTPESAARLLPAIFTLCGRAHRIAATLAVEAAQGRQRVLSAAEAAELRRETLAEHLRRLWLDWPRLLSDRPVDDAAMRPLAAGLAMLDDAPALRVWIDAQLLGMPAQAWFAAWRARDDAALATWWTARPSLPAAILAPIAEEAAAIALATEPALPEPRAGPGPLGPWESGSWTRAGAPAPRHALDRLLSRIAEVLVLADVMPTAEAPLHGAALPCGEGLGIGWCDMARGRLVHRVQLAGTGPESRIAGYEVDAPTEVNFDPHGAVAQALERIPADSQAERRSRIVACAFDPCVEIDIVTAGAHRTCTS